MGSQALAMLRIPRGETRLAFRNASQSARLKMIRRMMKIKELS